MSLVRYTELANTLVKNIAEGEFRVGDQLPSEMALADQYQVSRTTVRAALDIIEGLGMVTRRRRSGTVVRSTTPSDTYSKSLTTIDELVNYASHTDREVFEISNIVANEQLAGELECKPGANWLRISMLRTEKDEAHTPLCWTEAYLDPIVGQRIAPLVPNGPGLLCHIIEKEVGITVSDIKQTLSATSINDEMAGRLLAVSGTPGLQITRLYLDQAQKTFLITVNTYSSDKFRFTFWMHRTRQG